MLKSEVVPFLKSKRVWKKSVFQQDGAKPHTSNFSLERLRKFFPGGLISGRTDFPWPSNSSDFSPLDFFLWSWLKNKVYSIPKATTCEELIARIFSAYNELPQ